jgi:hypothetical protein
VTVSWFGPQSQACYDLSVVPQNRWKGDDVGHTSRSSGLLRMKASRARVFQYGLKTGGGTTQIVHVTLSQRLHRGQVEDGRVDTTGYVGLCSPCFTVLFVLGFRGNLVFYLDL